MDVQIGQESTGKNGISGPEAQETNGWKNQDDFDIEHTSHKNVPNEVEETVSKTRKRSRSVDVTVDAVLKRRRTYSDPLSLGTDHRQTDAGLSGDFKSQEPGAEGGQEVRKEITATTAGDASLKGPEQEENPRFYCPQCKHFCWLCCAANPEAYRTFEDQTTVCEFAAVQKGDQRERTEFRCRRCKFHCWLCSYVEPVTVDRPSTDYPTKSFSHKPRRRKQSSRTPSSSSSSDSRSFFDDMNPPPPRPGHSTPQSSSTARSSKRNRTDGLKFLGPRDPGFADYILESAGIVFTNDNGLKLSPEDIPQDVEEVVVQTTTTATERGTSNGSATKDARGGVGSTTAGTTQTTTIERPAQAPSAPTTMTATTTQQPTTMMTAAPPSGTFLKLDQAIAGRIANQFDLLCNRDHSEQDVRWLVDRFLALADDYVSSYGPTSALSLRRNNWHLKRPGPDIPPESKHTFDWVIEPDATYSVSIRLFDPAHRAVIAWVDMEWLLADFKSVCPYLTLEYKCADKGGKESDARNQIAVASAIWLLQRQTLRAQLRESDAGTGKVGLGLDLDSEIYHYSIVIKSRFYTIFRASINGLKYEIQQIGSGFLDSVNGVMEFADWINAIHRWGLGRNARIFRAEVEKTWQLRNEQRDG